MAADNGNVEAMNKYAALMKIKFNYEEAALYYKMAADKGNVEAMVYYARMAENGIGVEADNNIAAQYYKMAIENGFDCTDDLQRVEQSQSSICCIVF